jgi:competence protein ComEC
MFSLIAIGKNLQQHVNIYNIIAASAWILLLYNPKLLWQVGFQLSYLAVIGILLLHKKIYGLFTSKYIIIDKIWNLSAVSIAAQITTLPLGLYYFHLFPNYFLLANIFVIPLATIIVYMGVTLLAFSKITMLAKYIGIVLSKTILILNWFIEKVNSLPGSSSEAWHLIIIEVLLLYLLIILIFLAFNFSNKTSLKLSILTGLLLVISYNLSYFTNFEKKYLVVYNISKETAIEFHDGFHVSTLYSSGIQYKNNVFVQHIQNYWYAKKIKNHQTIPLANNNQVFKFANKTILIVDSAHENLQSDINFDYVIIKNQQKMYFEAFSKKIKAKCYIFDASNKPHQLKYWKKDCESLQENCYFVQEQSAFIQKLN